MDDPVKRCRLLETFYCSKIEISDRFSGMGRRERKNENKKNPIEYRSKIEIIII